MSISDFADIVREKIKTKTEELIFFENKIIFLDNQRELPLSIIKKIDKILFDRVDVVNTKLQNVKNAYQARIDAGCKSDLFWRVKKIDVVETDNGGYIKGSYFSAVNTKVYYTLECVKLSPNPYPRFFTRLPENPLNENYFYSNIPKSPPPPPPVEVIYLTPTGISSFNYNSSFQIEQRNLFGLKYYDEPYTRDIADTFVTSFPGTISYGSSTVTILSNRYSGSTDSIKVGQNLVCDKPFVFSGDFATIVSISSTLGSFDPLDTKIQAQAVGILSTEKFKIGIVSITNSGGGYSTTGNSPIVTISVPNAKTAIGTAVVSAAGSITQINLTNVGSGYTVAPTITILEPYVQTAVGIATTGVGGTVIGITTVNPGFGYTQAPTITIDDPPIIGVGIGTTATAISEISNGIVSKITIINPGFGYTTNPNVIFSSPGIITATAVAYISTTTGIVTGITITNPGLGYTSDYNVPPVINFSDPERIQATAISAVIEDNTVGFIELTNPGAGYTLAPSVYIEHPLDIKTPTNSLVVLTLNKTAQTSVSQPESNGSYPSFSVLISDQQLEERVQNLSLPFNYNAFSPQTIGIMTAGQTGIGVSIVLDNSGIQSSTRTWRPELKSDGIKIYGGQDIPPVLEPEVGAGKIYFTYGLDFYPIKTPNNPNDKASEGDIITVLVTDTNSQTYWIDPYNISGVVSLNTLVSNTTSCSTQITNNLNQAIQEANQAVSDLNSSLSDFQLKLNATNSFRRDLMEINKQIFSIRILMGQLQNELSDYQIQLDYATNPSIENPNNY